MSTTHFSVLIITYNSANEIPDLLNDLTRLAPPHPDRTTVIDNCSPDNTAHVVRTTFPDVDLVENSQNIGFARAVNQGIERCETECVFLLNPDVRIAQGNFFAAMLECLAHNPKVAAVGPLQFNRFDRRRRLIFTWSYCNRQTIGVFFSRVFGRNHAPDGPLPATFLNGGCLLLRKSAFLRAGRLNEEYLFYGEEPDLFLKFKLHGYECRLHPGVEVVHYRDRSLNTLPVSERLKRRVRGGYNIADALINGYLRIALAKPSGNRPPASRTPPPAEAP